VESDRKRGSVPQGREVAVSGGREKKRESLLFFIFYIKRCFFKRIHKESFFLHKRKREVSAGCSLQEQEKKE
jgi:hypothetical protein